MKYGFIGVGQMGGALARAVRRTLPEGTLLLANRTPERAEHLAQELSAQAVTAEQAAAASDLLFLGVKPQGMQELLKSLQGALSRNPGVVLVSMAAGLSMQSIQEMAGGERPVIRIMPNTPVSIGQGMILYDCTPNVSAAQERCLLEALGQAGQLDRLPERLIDAGSALAGCGPAFVFMMLEALADGAVECGLPRDKSTRYAAQTMLGASSLLLETGEHPGRLKDAVCSPGGSTIAGVHALESHAFRAAAMEAVVAAYQRTLSFK